MASSRCSFALSDEDSSDEMQVPLKNNGSQSTLVADLLLENKALKEEAEQSKDEISRLKEEMAKLENDFNDNHQAVAAILQHANNKKDDYLEILHTMIFDLGTKMSTLSTASNAIIYTRSLQKAIESAVVEFIKLRSTVEESEVYENAKETARVEEEARAAELQAIEAVKHAEEANIRAQNLEKTAVQNEQNLLEAETAAEKFIAAVENAETAWIQIQGSGDNPNLERAKRNSAMTVERAKLKAELARKRSDNANKEAAEAAIKAIEETQEASSKRCTADKRKCLI